MRLLSLYRIILCLTTSSFLKDDVDSVVFASDVELLLSVVAICLGVGGALLHQTSSIAKGLAIG